MRARAHTHTYSHLFKYKLFTHPTDLNEIVGPPVRPISNSPHLSENEDTMNRSLCSMALLVTLILVSFFRRLLSRFYRLAYY